MAKKSCSLPSFCSSRNSLVASTELLNSWWSTRLTPMGRSHFFGRFRSESAERKITIYSNSAYGNFSRCRCYKKAWKCVYTSMVCAKLRSRAFLFKKVCWCYNSFRDLLTNTPLRGRERKEIASGRAWTHDLLVMSHTLDLCATTAIPTSWTFS